MENMWYELKPFLCFALGVAAPILAPKTLIFGAMLVWASLVIFRWRHKFRYGGN